MNSKLFQLKDDIDLELIDPEGSLDLDFFCTDFGQEFEAYYLDLMSFSRLSIFLMPTLFDMLSKLLPAIESGEFTNRLVNMDLTDLYKNDSQIQQDAIRDALYQFKELQEKLRQIPPENSIELKSSNIIDKYEAFETSISGIIEILQLLPRILAHFIITLYVYADVYVASLYKAIISISNVRENEFFNIIKGYKADENPNKRLKHILKKPLL